MLTRVEQYKRFKDALEYATFEYVNKKNNADLVFRHIVNGLFAMQMSDGQEKVTCVLEELGKICEIGHKEDAYTTREDLEIFVNQQIEGTISDLNLFAT